MGGGRIHCSVLSEFLYKMEIYSLIYKRAGESSWAWSALPVVQGWQKSVFEGVFEHSVLALIVPAWKGLPTVTSHFEWSDSTLTTFPSCSSLWG